jgi:DNA-binding NtrC family response regulator
LGDLPLLVDYFLAKSAAMLGRKKPTPPAELFTLLKTHDFPGNIRELEGMIHNAVSLHKNGKLSLASFKECLFNQPHLLTENNSRQPEDQIGLFVNQNGTIPTLHEANKYLIETAMDRADGNQGIAAKLLGISRQALNRRLVRGKNA